MIDVIRMIEKFTKGWTPERPNVLKFDVDPHAPAMNFIGPLLDAQAEELVFDYKVNLDYTVEITLPQARLKYYYEQQKLLKESLAC